MPFESASGSYIALVGAIIRSGLKQEGPDYPFTDGGRYWCSVGNLDPAVVRKLALGSQEPRPQLTAPAADQKRAA